MASEQIKKVIEETINSYDEKLRAISVDIHEHPELGNNEFRAYGLLTDFLEKEGFKVTHKAAGLETAFIAEYSNGKEGRRVAFCSEYDALPGVGHACGHNLIAISGVSCALATKKLLEENLVNGTVYLFGTPAEESTSGKTNFVKEGLLKDLADFALMLHPGPGNACWVKYLALDSFVVEFFGKASHAGAAPWMGVNAVDALMQGFNNVALLRQQTLPSNRVHGIVTNGGQAANVIPAYASAKFYTRTVTRDQLKEFKPRIENCFRAAALATGCDYKIEWASYGEIHDVFTNDTMAEQFIKYQKEEGEQFYPRFREEQYVSGSTDFGNFTYVVPGLHPGFFIGTRSACHTKDFATAAITEEAHTSTLRASRSLAKVAADVLVDDELYKKVVADFEKGKQVGF